ncbi:MAG: hypothetical protein Mars2KO_34220 [Maribacter sp.]|uniref:DUF3244 domain-containing protein n=1 Tax=Maribacter sp. 2307UL18-2 TaxID=3386274 RepID=UPI0039BD23A4
MKKVVRSIATVALMFVVATSMAKEPKLSVAHNTEKSLIFEMEKPSNQTVVSIQDIEGVIIYSEEVADAATYLKKFDLRNLPDGNYILKVEDSLKVTVFEFDINDSDVSIVERKENTKPVFKKDGQKVFLNLLNTDKEDVKITIYDSENRIVFKETVSDTLLVEKAFNFEKAYEDTYRVVVKNGEDTFYENISVK